MREEILCIGVQPSHHTMPPPLPHPQSIPPDEDSARATNYLPPILCLALCHQLRICFSFNLYRGLLLPFSKIWGIEGLKDLPKLRQLMSAGAVDLSVSLHRPAAGIGDLPWINGHTVNSWAFFLAVKGTKVNIKNPSVCFHFSLAKVPDSVSRAGPQSVSPFMCRVRRSPLWLPIATWSM